MISNLSADKLTAQNLATLAVAHVDADVIAGAKKLVKMGCGDKVYHERIGGFVFSEMDTRDAWLYFYLDAQELRKLARAGGVSAVKRGGKWIFKTVDLIALSKQA